MVKIPRTLNSETFVPARSFPRSVEAGTGCRANSTTKNIYLIFFIFYFYLSFPSLDFPCPLITLFFQKSRGRSEEERSYHGSSSPSSGLFGYEHYKRSTPIQSQDQNETEHQRIVLGVTLPRSMYYHAVSAGLAHHHSRMSLDAGNGIGIGNGKCGVIVRPRCDGWVVGGGA